MSTKCLLLAAFAVLVDSASTWNYDRCSPEGPDHWVSIGQCNGKQQTPINLCDAIPFPSSKSSKRSGKEEKDGKKKDDDDHDDDDDNDDDGKYGFHLSSGYNKKERLTIQNTGHTVQISGPSVTVRAPHLSHLVGRAESNTNPNQEWQFAQMHLHWGRESNPNEGSEHAVANRRYAAEAHFVHFNKARGNTLTQAVMSGKKDALLVLGVFLELGSEKDETELVRATMRYVPRLEGAPAKTLVTSEKLALGELIDTYGAFFSYGGGLTTPGCLEMVTWIVLQKPEIISVQSLTLLQTAMDAGGFRMSEYGNFRPLLPLGSRKLYLSKGSSPVCLPQEIADTCYICDNKSPHRQASSALNEEQSASTCTTPSWVWIVIGVAIPAALIVGTMLAFCIMVQRQRQCASDEMVMFTPLPEPIRSVPNSVVDEEGGRR